MRKGRKRHPFYYIVAADSRAPRDGRFIERIGDYDPNTNPATINLNLDSSVNWLQNGAQPTETVRAILSYKGAMHKDHLLRGAAKGAFPVEEVEARFEKWMSEKEGRIENKRTNLAEASSKAAKERLEREAKVREAREKAILAKNSPMAEEVAVSDDAPTSDYNPEGATEEASEVEVAAETAAETEVAEVEAEAEVVEEAPVVEDAAATDDTPIAEETAETEDSTAAEETPASEEAPAEVAETEASEEEKAPE